MFLDAITITSRLLVLMKGWNGFRMEYLAHSFCVTAKSLGGMVALRIVSAIRKIFAIPSWV